MTDRQLINEWTVGSVGIAVALASAAGAARSANLQRVYVQTCQRRDAAVRAAAATADRNPSARRRLAALRHLNSIGA